MRELRNCNEIVKMDSRTVEGYALVFGKQSRDLGGFTEVIEPTALEGILEKSDILCLLNHNEDVDFVKFVYGLLKLRSPSSPSKRRADVPRGTSARRLDGEEGERNFKRPYTNFTKSTSSL